MNFLEKYITSEYLYNLLISIGSKILIGAAVLIIGLYLIKLLVNASKKVLSKAYDDATLITFLSSLLSIALKLILVISVLALIGIEMTSFIALFGAAGLAIGLAFQGTLANFAAGVLILLFRPFDVGDRIKSQDLNGKVKEIQVLYTILETDDNKRVVMPNNGVYSNIIFVNK
ncbi:mechanosensitive ion channel family protein [Pseudobacteroides cellulosolvens]|uniref:MscS Mechanosensitive ion channel n=1 Tax=Pseudobacteroides cellulosolvens ATCC 35603 = DSM 2933 TaxID=398512 RepID=A0A0L6JIC6_9FIRM|nr:mechanosensitive ion channel domain-containing protein [Pseudobacteroides cellulosolvens]KNY25202.1 MscS Mechanosensitive ion channel [Pseudobacteroides cellulosolvens ATCC 35603 = DSM 2933]